MLAAPPPAGAEGSSESDHLQIYNQKDRSPDWTKVGVVGDVGGTPSSRGRGIVRAITNKYNLKDRSPYWPKVGVIGDVGLARDDRHTLQPGQRDRQSDPHIRAHPQQALISPGECHVNLRSLVFWWSESAEYGSLSRIFIAVESSTVQQ